MVTKNYGYDDHEPVDVRHAGLDKKFINMVAQRQACKAEMERLEKEVKDYNVEILAQLTKSGYKTVLTPDWRVTFTQGTHTQISKERLLECGVSVKIIEKATKKTTYETVTVTANKS